MALSRKKKRKLISVVSTVAVLLIAFAVIAIILIRDYRDSHAPSTETMTLAECYAIPEGRAMLIIDGSIYAKQAYVADGTYYIDIDTVERMYAPGFFVDGECRIYSTADAIYDIWPDDAQYRMNGNMITGSAPFLRTYSDTLHVSLEFLDRFCGITYRLRHDPEVIMITYSGDDYLCYDCVKDTVIRYNKDIKAPILAEISAGEQLRMVDGGLKSGGFIKVMTDDGVRGYVEESALGKSYYEQPTYTSFEAPEYTHLRRESKIYMGWQLLYAQDNLTNLREALNLAPELNVIAPTWFYLYNTDGTVLSYANKDYVEAAHKAGVEVWATYKNDTIDKKFACTEDTHRILSSMTARRRLIDSMMQDAELYGYDGINIDFELLKKDCGIWFTQFLRELSVRCRKAGIVLSVDNYVPMSYNAYYDLPSQAKLVDYVVIMGYDEHTVSSEEPGSVSSYSWFSSAIDSTLAKIDAEGVIMGIPFYTRLWRIKNGKLRVEDTLGMADAQTHIKGWKITWDEDAGQYYAEYSKYSTTYKIWMEEEESITRRISAIRDSGMAGVAAWKLGDEREGIWSLIVKTMQTRPKKKTK